MDNKMENNKRERCVNWEQEEKQLFRNILRPYLPIIENKDLRTSTSKEKMKAWIEITEKFNVANFRTRDKKQLINQWKCLKLNSKKELSSYRQDMSKIGGGPKPSSPSPDTVEVAEMIPQEFEVDYNEFDCDGVKDVTSEVIFENTQETEPIINDIRNDEIFPKVKDDRSKSEHPQKTPKNLAKKRLKANNKDHFNFGEASYADMHYFRVLENERLQKEHELRMKNMAEIHSQVMTNLKLQSEILAKTLKSHNK